MKQETCRFITCSADGRIATIVQSAELAPSPTEANAWVEVGQSFETAAGEFVKAVDLDAGLFEVHRWPVPFLTNRVG
jgi:hypothetical protein